MVVSSQSQRNGNQDRAVRGAVRPLCEADEALQVVTTGACLSVGAAQSCAVNYRS